MLDVNTKCNRLCFGQIVTFAVLIGLFILANLHDAQFDVLRKANADLKIECAQARKDAAAALQTLEKYAVPVTVNINPLHGNVYK